MQSNTLADLFSDDVNMVPQRQTSLLFIREDERREQEEGQRVTVRAPPSDLHALNGRLRGVLLENLHVSLDHLESGNDVCRLLENCISLVEDMHIVDDRVYNVLSGEEIVQREEEDATSSHEGTLSTTTSSKTREGPWMGFVQCDPKACDGDSQDAVTLASQPPFRDFGIYFHAVDENRLQRGCSIGDIMFRSMRSPFFYEISRIYEEEEHERRIQSVVEEWSSNVAPHYHAISNDLAQRVMGGLKLFCEHVSFYLDRPEFSHHRGHIRAVRLELRETVQRLVELSVVNRYVFKVMTPNNLRDLHLYKRPRLLKTVNEKVTLLHHRFVHLWEEPPSDSADEVY